MEQVIQLLENSAIPQVSGRKLHAALAIKTRYTDWFPRMCKYGFVEGKDYVFNYSENECGRLIIDHILTLTMAKELCVIQRNKVGAAVRKYLIETEKRWNDPDAIIQRAMAIAEERTKTAISRLTIESG